MIHFELIRDRGILLVTPDGPLAKADFEQLTREIDPFIASKGKLVGVMIYSRSFPGWESFGALVEHMKFVRDHHRKINRVAVVTDSTVLTVAPKIAEHFAHPEFKVFKSGERVSALAWLEAP